MKQSVFDDADYKMTGGNNMDSIHFNETIEFVNDVLADCQIYIFGAGENGNRLRETLDFLKLNSFAGFVDNNVEKQKAGWAGCRVIPLAEYLKRNTPRTLIVCCSKKNRPFIEEQLAKNGLKQNIDFYTEDYFRMNLLPAYVLCKQKRSYMPFVQTCVTERCTLRCKKCAHGCHTVPAHYEDMRLEDVKKSADELFGHVDYVEFFHLIGGEPLLYRELAKALDYIGTRYNHQIYRLCVTTNGTILPDKELIASLKQQNVLVYISDYRRTLPALSDRYDALERLLKENMIDYVFDDYEQEWTDYGFDSLDRGFFKDGELVSDEPPRELIHVFEQCKTPCREIRGNKLFYCVQARACADNMGFQVGKEDFLDISALDDSFDSKKKLTMFEMGYIEKGYLDMCNYCYGAEREQHPVRVAEQI
ncbi:MAG: radical SAM protein [Acetatifactor sp.]|nr:radical SAM protein [Acetatifactor sp.]